MKWENMLGGGFVFTDADGHIWAKYRDAEVMADHHAIIMHQNQVLKVLRSLPLDAPTPTNDEVRKAQADNNAFLVGIAYKHGEISTGRSAELLGTDIVSAREILMDQLGEEYPG